MHHLDRLAGIAQRVEEMIALNAGETIERSDAVIDEPADGRRRRR
jgi:hypothetical protein